MAVLLPFKTEKDRSHRPRLCPVVPKRPKMSIDRPHRLNFDCRSTSIETSLWVRRHITPPKIEAQTETNERIETPTSIAEMVLWHDESGLSDLLPEWIEVSVCDADFLIWICFPACFVFRAEVYSSDLLITTSFRRFWGSVVGFSVVATTTLASSCALLETKEVHSVNWLNWPMTGFEDARPAVTANDLAFDSECLIEEEFLPAPGILKTCSGSIRKAFRSSMLEVARFEW